MNIAFYFEYQINPERGGTERVTESLAQFFMSREHKVFYLAKVPVDGTTNKIQTFFLPDAKGFATAKNIDFVKTFIGKNNIDIIINQAGNLDDVYLFSHKSLGSDIKIITCIHFSVDYGIRYFYRSLPSLEIDLKTPQVSIKNVIKRILAPYYKIQRKRNIKKRNSFICNDSDRVVLLASNYVEEIKTNTLLKSINNVSYIHNPNPYLSPTLNTKKNKEIIFVGRLSAQKKPEYLLDIWDALYEKHSDWKLTFIGDGPLKNSLMQKTKQKKMENVSFTGFTNSYPYYERAAILCMTSLYEGLPMVILEAKLHGVIPIIYDTYSASVDLITNNETGFIISAFKKNEYVKCLSKLMDNDNLRHEMMLKSYEDSKRFDIKAIGQQWESLFSELNTGRK